MTPEPEAVAAATPEPFLVRRQRETLALLSLLLVVAGMIAGIKEPSNRFGGSVTRSVPPVMMTPPMPEPQTVPPGGVGRAPEPTLPSDLPTPPSVPALPKPPSLTPPSLPSG